MCYLETKLEVLNLSQDCLSQFAHSYPLIMEAYTDIRPSTSQPCLHLASTLDPRPGRDYILDLRPDRHFTF